jgi:hypothetical protein
MCRWLNPDPIGQKGGLNLYEFVQSNPINLIDPNGESPKKKPSINPNSFSTASTRLKIGSSFKTRQIHTEKRGKAKYWGSYMPLSKTAYKSAQYWADLYVEGQVSGGIKGNLKKTFALVLGPFASLWIPENSIGTTLTLGTLGLGAAAQAGRLGRFSTPTLYGLGIWGSFESGNQIGMAITGRSMSGKRLSFTSRVLNGIFGSLGILMLGVGKFRSSRNNSNLPSPKVRINLLNTKVKGKIKPINGKVNVGGVNETPDWTNLNPNLTSRQDLSNVKNLVRGRAENIGSIFQKGSVKEMMSSKLPESVNVEKFAKGAFQVMAKGGKFELNFFPWTKNYIERAKKAFTNAGFKNVRFDGIMISGNK